MSPVDLKPSMSLWARDAVSDLKSAPQTFTSWDKCMAKSYCKWPVIVGIIVGGVIIIAILACIINCLCCGIQCCTGCCRCITCCCPSPHRSRKRTKYMDEPSPYHHEPPPPMPTMPKNNAYQPPAPPTYTYRGAQVARFDSPASSPAVSKFNESKYNEDSLPEMPTWDNAKTRRIEERNSTNPSPHAEDMEMEPLNRYQQPRWTPSPAPSQVPSAARSPVARSPAPRSPSGMPPSPGGYMMNGPPAPARVGTPGRMGTPGTPAGMEAPARLPSPGAMGGAPARIGSPATLGAPVGTPMGGMMNAPPPARIGSPGALDMPSPGMGPGRSASPAIGMALGGPMRMPSPGPMAPGRVASPSIGTALAGPLRMPSPGPGAVPARVNSPGIGTALGGGPVQMPSSPGPNRVASPASYGNGPQQSSPYQPYEYKPYEYQPYEYKPYEYKPADRNVGINY